MSARAFAIQLRRWAQRAGADAAGQELAAAFGQRVTDALEQGDACVPLTPAEAAAAPSSGVVAPAACPGSHPLLLDAQGRLYLHRLFDAEQRVARVLAGMAGAPVLAGPAPQLPAGPAPSDQDPQQQALALALARRLVVISGGPGTGKTSTVARMLQALREQQPELRVVLAAPTGKAAARLQEALRERLASSGADGHALTEVPAGTVHRLLGQDHQGRVRHHAGNPLPLDLLVVDEASMLDLVQAARLCDALPAHARLVLLGDRDQLAAVESGAVFAELAGLPPAHPMRASVLQFERQYRFPAGSALGRLADAVRRGDAGAALETLRQGDAGLAWQPSAAQGAAADSTLLHTLEQGWDGYWRALDDGSEAAAVFAAFARFRVLCALRSGPWGSEAVAEALERLARARLDAPAAGGYRSPWYRGRPVMVTRNDPLLRLWNGDVGIALPDGQGELAVHFPADDGGFRRIAPVRLPPHETAFATSVHKAQGSEFERVALLLPLEPAPVLSRELVYTGITRARQGVRLVGPVERLGEALANPTRRQSGLVSRLDEWLAAAAGREPGGSGLV